MWCGETLLRHLHPYSLWESDRYHHGLIPAICRYVAGPNVYWENRCSHSAARKMCSSLLSTIMPQVTEAGGPLSFRKWTAPRMGRLLSLPAVFACSPDGCVPRLIAVQRGARWSSLHISQRRGFPRSSHILLTQVGRHAPREREYRKSGGGVEARGRCRSRGAESRDQTQCAVANVDQRVAA